MYNIKITEKVYTGLTIRDSLNTSFGKKLIPYSVVTTILFASIISIKDRVLYDASYNTIFLFCGFILPILLSIGIKKDTILSFSLLPLIFLLKFIAGIVARQDMSHPALYSGVFYFSVFIFFFYYCYKYPEELKNIGIDVQKIIKDIPYVLLFSLVVVFLIIYALLIKIPVYQKLPVEKIVELKFVFLGFPRTVNLLFEQAFMVLCWAIFFTFIFTIILKLGYNKLFCCFLISFILTIIYFPSMSITSSLNIITFLALFMIFIILTVLFNYFITKYVSLFPLAFSIIYIFEYTALALAIQAGLYGQY